MSTATTDPTATTDTPPLPREHLLVIGTLLVASFVVILNETVMSVAVPVLQDDLGVPPSTGQWLTTAFMLTMAVVIPLTGYLIQRVATRTLYVAAMSLFTAGTVLAFASQGFAMLLVARVVQASGTAVMLPLLMTTVMTIVPVARRGAMMGNITVVIAVAPALAGVRPRRHRRARAGVVGHAHLAAVRRRRRGPGRLRRPPAAAAA
ncbi:MFS transporter [Aeromicrobium sp. REDSEA-S32_B7]|uniref:MFS transporter n=1 Tax=Aeromicrobium sp. REDSEA-S32_B7 TaxID=1811526 RepID=UPI000B0F4E70|nr:MFS transporter [Aeromicrobium sp. REDSEA-S32_B7]